MVRAAPSVLSEVATEILFEDQSSLEQYFAKEDREDPREKGERGIRQVI